jgi:hypothetical protein
LPGADLFFYKIQPVRPEMLSVGATDDERRIASEHFEYLEGLTRAGTVLLAGRTLNTDTSKPWDRSPPGRVGGSGAGGHAE